VIVQRDIKSWSRNTTSFFGALDFFTEKPVTCGHQTKVTNKMHAAPL
jgi:hypothetical protein